jgi:hypothetical protein
VPHIKESIVHLRESRIISHENPNQNANETSNFDVRQQCQKNYNNDRTEQDK